MKLSKSRVLLLLLPSLFFLVVPLFGLFSAAEQSFQAEGNWTFQAYSDLFTSDRFFTSLGFSLKIAFLSTLFSVLIGFALTRTLYPVLTRHTPRLIVWLPMLFPHFVWGYMVILVLSETGLISQALVVLGVLDHTDPFPVWTRDPHGIGIMVTYIWKEIPFVVLMLLPVYASIKPAFYDVVSTLGGGEWSKFKAVEWPVLFPVLMETALIIFAFTLSAYEVPALLGTTYPEMLPVLSYEWYYDGSWAQRPLALASMMVLTLVIVGSALIYYASMYSKKGRK